MAYFQVLMIIFLKLKNRLFLLRNDTRMHELHMHLQKD